MCVSHTLKLSPSTAGALYPTPPENVRDPGALRQEQDRLFACIETSMGDKFVAWRIMRTVVIHQDEALVHRIVNAQPELQFSMVNPRSRQESVSRVQTKHPSQLGSKIHHGWYHAFVCGCFTEHLFYVC